MNALNFLNYIFTLNSSPLENGTLEVPGKGKHSDSGAPTGFPTVKSKLLREV